MLVHGNARGLFHAHPEWTGADRPLGEQTRRSIVGRRMAERLDEACHDRLLRRARPGTPIRLRVGHAVSGLGDRIAGEGVRPRPA